MWYHEIGPAQSPPSGQTAQFHTFGSNAVLFKQTLLSLQSSTVFQFRLVQVDEPSLGWTHPVGQATHEMLGTAF